MLQAGGGAPTSSSVRGTENAFDKLATRERPRGYRFDDIEVDPSLGCIRRAGVEQHLRQQSFHVLVYLIERRGSLIGKEELIDNFWKGAAVTDNAVVQCIKEIRKALGDDPHEPRFIRTVHKIGYRFIATITEEVSRTEWEPPSLVRPETYPVEEPKFALAVQPQRFRFKPLLPWILLALVATAALVLAAAAVLRRPASPRVDITLPQVPGGKALAVMYFENQTAKADLNWLSEGLADMFITDMAHLGRLTVLSRQQLHLLLERRGRRTVNGVNLDDALDIARKSHADAVLLGSFMALGERLVVSVRLFDSANGQLIAADQFVVDQPAEILTRVDLLSPKLAARLGTVPLDRGKQTGLAEAMTNNLEAYRYYSLGVSKAQAFQNAQATALLRKAIQLDPSFAMAYARIGYAYSVTDFLPEAGRPFLEKAIHLSDRLAPKDRLFVTAWYAIARQDYPAAIRTLQQVVEQYPLETEGYTRLARLLYGEERPQESITVVQRGLAVDRDCGDLYNVLGVCYLGLGRYDDAIAAHQRYVQLAPNEPNSHDSLGMSFQQSGRYEMAVAEYNAALSLDPEFEPAIIHLGDVFFQQGRYRESIRQYRRYIQVTGSDAARAVGYSSIGQVYRRLRDYIQAEQAARDEARYAKGAVWSSLLLAVERGETIRAAQLKEQVLKSSRDVRYPGRGSRDELRSYEYHLGSLSLGEKQASQAIAHFQVALRHLPPSSGLDLYEDCLANAYLELGRLDEAITEYQRILRLNPNYPLAQYHLAQAYEHKGELDQARAAYERFLQIWKGADADIPEIVATRKQLLALAPEPRA